MSIAVQPKKAKEPKYCIWKLKIPQYKMHTKIWGQ